MNDSSDRAISTFLARLEHTQADIGGTARISMADIPRASWQECRDIASARGWRFHTFEYESGVPYWVLTRPDVKPVSRRDPYFLKGPALAELRAYPEARAVAEQVKREHGVDPLSDAALDEVRGQHLTLYRKAVRYAGIAAISGIALLVILLFAWRQLTSGGAATLILGAVSLLLLVALVGGWVAAARAQRTRRNALRAFTEGYERVVAAVYAKGN